MKRNFLCIVLMITVIAGLLISCGQGSRGDLGKVYRANFDPASFPPAPEGYTITILTVSHTGEIISNDHPAFRQLEEHTGYKIRLEYVLNANYSEQINTRLSSGILPGLIVITGNTMPIVMAAESGAFWDITEVYDLYPNLAAADKNVMNNISIGGRYYGIYRARDIGRAGMVYRSDWLENLGLEVPKTLDDLYKVLHAFTNNNPTRTGANTFGMNWTGAHMGPFHDLAVMHGAPNRFGVKDGKLVPWFEYPEFFEAMVYSKRLYDEGLINRDFAALPTGEWAQAFGSNRSGWHMDVADEAGRSANALRDNGFITREAWNAGRHVSVMGSVANKNGEKFSRPTPGHNGYVAISTVGAKTLQDLHYYLDFMDKLNDATGQTLLNWGAEDVNWTRNDDDTITLVAAANLPSGLGVVEGLNQFRMMQHLSLTMRPNPYQAQHALVYEENLQYVVHDPTLPIALMSPTWTARSASLNQIIDDAVINFIMGNSDNAGFEREKTRWYNEDGRKALEELQAVFK